MGQRPHSASARNGSVPGPRSDIIPSSTYIADSAEVHEEATLGPGCSVWQLAQVREHAELGRDCVVGRGAYVGAGVQIGDRVKIQNHALIYEPARVDDGAFIGPAVVLTNDCYPRAINPDGTAKSLNDWHPVGVTVQSGASLGARSVCVAPVTIGRWAMVAAGAVVTNDVPAHALVVGVPARQVGWVGTAGVRLERRADDRWVCPRTSEVYVETDGTLALDHAQAIAV